MLVNYLAIYPAKIEKPGIFPSVFMYIFVWVGVFWGRDCLCSSVFILMFELVSVQLGYTIKLLLYTITKSKQG